MRSNYLFDGSEMSQDINLRKHADTSSSIFSSTPFRRSTIRQNEHIAQIEMLVESDEEAPLKLTKKDSQNLQFNAMTLFAFNGEA